MAIDRRGFFAVMGIAPAALFVAGTARAADALCYDPEALPLSQKNRRRSLRYVDVSTDPKRRCGICAFFMAKPNACGTCQLLNGGPVPAAAVCASFAAKAA